MSTTFRPYAPDQSLLLPPDVREWQRCSTVTHSLKRWIERWPRLPRPVVPATPDGERAPTLELPTLPPAHRLENNAQGEAR